ncbi:gliding motility lipoprotein GldB [Moheibacter sediminis]|uniref:Gliding motility-associated lipoprotein GldB n=1 Tax=Moheibacter sediminis TaxID=1434700 RepID=A0A1W1YMD4_9FLAO|nr:gliding motility protein, GldB [Moheibacter sediminis]SMC36878.1 hypothetical protein SAMN06296427_101512 [Moheibacter sediminis]
MKTVHWIGILMLFLVISCGKENRWDIELPQEKVDLEVTDISKDFFDTNIPLTEVQARYPFFFLDTVSNQTWEKQRRDPFEKAVYDSVIKVFKKYGKTQNELEELFAYYKHYFPKQDIPQIFTYSSTLQENIYTPVIYGAREGLMFIAMDGFLGTNNQLYKQQAPLRVYDYMAQNMNPQNLPPAVVRAIGQEIIPFDPRQQTFGDLMVDEGKKLILADALLPQTSDNLKIGYTTNQMKWAKENEGNVWNYFVEQNMVFQTDKSLRQRFIDFAPFSKFLNEIETQTPGRMGVFIGWQICKAYLDKNEEMTLGQFLNTDTQTIFNGSKYKPKKGDGNYTPTKPESNDEVKKYE